MRILNRLRGNSSSNKDEIEVEFDLGGREIDTLFMLRHEDDKKLQIKTTNGEKFGFKLTDDQAEMLNKMTDEHTT